MKNAMKKLLSLALAVMLLLSVVPFQAFAVEGADTLLPNSDMTPVDNGDTDKEPENKEPENKEPENKEPENKEPADKSSVGTYSMNPVFKYNENYVNVYFYVDGALLGAATRKVGESLDLVSGDEVFKRFSTSTVGGTADNYEFLGWSYDDYYYNNVLEANHSSAGIRFAQNPLTVGGEKTYLVPENGDEGAALKDASGKEVGMIKLYAVLRKRPAGKVVQLNAGQDATVSPASITVVAGDKYPVEVLQTIIPVRTGFVFQGWYVQEDQYHAVRTLVDKDGKPGTGDLTVLSTNARPYAEWKPYELTVSVKWYDFTDGTNDGWTDFEYNGTTMYKDMPLADGSSLRAGHTFPTNEVIAKMPTDGYTFAGWKFLTTGADFKGTVNYSNADASGNIVIVPKLVREIPLIAVHPEDTKSQESFGTIAVEIGAKITGKLPMPNALKGTNKNYAFVEWRGLDGTAGTLIADRDNLGNDNNRPVYYPNMSKPNGSSCTHAYGTNPHFEAIWKESRLIRLHFYVNYDTKNEAGVGYCYEIPNTGTFNMNNLDLYQYFKNYGKYTDGVDKQYGWFTEKQWEDYATGMPFGTNGKAVWDVQDTTNMSDLYMMLIDNGSDPQKYNNNNKTADKTNPKTGDIILAVVAVMAVSGAALAGVYYVTKKKRSAK